MIRRLLRCPTPARLSPALGSQLTTSPMTYYLPPRLGGPTAPTSLSSPAIPTAIGSFTSMMIPSISLAHSAAGAWPSPALNQSAAFTAAQPISRSASPLSPTRWSLAIISPTLSPSPISAPPQLLASPSPTPCPPARCLFQPPLRKARAPTLAAPMSATSARSPAMRRRLYRSP